MNVVKSAVLIVLFALLAGCSFSGQIGVSHPRIWRQDTIAQDATSRIGELKETREELNEALKRLAGWRLRKEIIDTKLSASASRRTVASGTPPSTTAPDPKGGASQEPPSISLQDLSALGKEVGEEALDLLRRQEDFGDLFTGTLLKYIRDDASLTKDHELYLLGFDVSVNAGGWTSSSGLISSGYNAYVRIEIEKVTPYDDVRVYAVAPQQYAERFKEGLALRNDLSLALALEQSGPGQGGKFALDRARKSQEELALIQRYPLISGFIEKERVFGWSISPRFRIADRHWSTGWLFGNYTTESGMEDGVRSVLAAIAVKVGDEKKKQEDKTLKLKISTYWESAKWHHRIEGEPKEMAVILPGDPVKKFKGPTPVHPSSGPGNVENIVTIRGDDFGSRADVYVGTMKACQVRVLNRQFIEAKLPKCYENQACSGTPLDVKVISQGDSYLNAGVTTFTYVAPLAQRPKEPEPKLCEMEQGTAKAASASGKPPP